ncbi:ABC transporter G family member 20-like [Panonychus citri]|uniref:ABC transporter G family member 20-like n=1 Tax=Panonychus citri TaxID=50023 RepID=UPI002307B9D4|nr:ABC transporter G family member 20-like [Panonychus citri]
MTHRLCLRQNKIKGLFLGSTIVTIFLIGLTILCNGRTPIVSIGVVNNEQENNGSKIFLNKINQQILHLVSYNSSELAHHDTLNDKLSGYLTISSQFTPELISKYTFNDNKLIASKPAMVFNGDAIKLVVLNTITFILESALDESLPEIMSSSGINPILGSPYAIIVDPIAKTDSLNDLYNSRNHWIPKFVVFWSFTVTIFLSTFTFYRDRNEPFFDRNLSSGATKGQFVIGHFITSLVVPLVNSWPVLLISVYFLGLQQKGSLIIVWLIYISNCSTAIVSAFLIASAPIDAFFVFVLSSTYVFCGLASTGIVWPFHALPYFFKPFTKWIPLTVNYDSLIRVLSHGHPWNDPVVLWGLAHNLGYVVIILMIVRFIL